MSHTVLNVVVSILAVVSASLIAKFVIELVRAFERDIDERENRRLEAIYGKRQDGEP